jgi:hypothetical protein
VERENRPYSKTAIIETFDQGIAYALQVISRRAVSSFELKKN